MTELDPAVLAQQARAAYDEAVPRLRAAASLEELARVRAEVLGKRGALKQLLGRISELPKEQRATAAREMNQLRAPLERLIAERRARLEAEADAGAPDPTFDPTWPGRRPVLGSLHPVTLVIDEIGRIFTRLGFDEASGPELEDAWHNFDALNIPPEHPAREPSDNFYVEGGRLLRSQTSTVQIRVMEHRAPPLRVFAPGRVYRPETVDARHLYAFHQVEGLMVGPGVTFADLKACLNTFARSMYGADVQTRFRPSYFPFTETSAELDLRCPACARAGDAAGDGLPGTSDCHLCGGEGWMEILGCGMVHPRVLQGVGIDPEVHTGFAFGMGVERVAMRRWHLDDIRLLVENDDRFLSQFA